jgi:adenylate cyclase
VLFTWLVMHLTNHALGLVSIEAMEAGRIWVLLLWRNPVGTTLLYGAFLTHFTLAAVAIYQRRTLRIPPLELLRLSLGLSIPLLVVSHMIGTRLSHEWYGTVDSYSRIVWTLWSARPDLGVRQSLLLLIAWTHACIGLHLWLVSTRWYARMAPLFLVAAVLVPVLAWLGFADAGKELARASADPAWLPRMQREWRLPAPAQRAILDTTVTVSYWTLAGLMAAAFVARGVRSVRERFRHAICIVYPDARAEVRVARGTSVLEASRIGGIAHASVCGGRGRCSTCRVRVVNGAGGMPPPSAAEARVLARVAAGQDVRLACQLRPVHDLAVIRLLPPDVSIGDAGSAPAELAGDEQDVTIFFADLRRFTRIAERRLPYDVVFILNRYFDAVGTAIAHEGGITNQFTGDGVMALFGVGAAPAVGARQALAAARTVTMAVAQLSTSLANELRTPLRIGIGIHTGPAVVGRMGHGEAMYLTAVGDSVHVASRLQDMTKDFDCQLVMSEHVATLAGIDTSGLPRHEITVRNRTEPLAVRVVEDVQVLGVPRSPAAPVP